MAIAHVGAGTVLYETSLPNANEVKGSLFADSRASKGTAVVCWAAGSGGTLNLYKVMKHSGEEVLVGTESVVAGTEGAAVIVVDFPLGQAKASFTPTTFGDITKVEIEMRSLGR